MSECPPGVTRLQAKKLPKPLWLRWPDGKIGVEPQLPKSNRNFGPTPIYSIRLQLDELCHGIGGVRLHVIGVNVRAVAVVRAAWKFRGYITIGAGFLRHLFAITK